jgi:hypothetical protein
MLTLFRKFVSIGGKGLLIIPGTVCAFFLAIFFYASIGLIIFGIPALIGIITGLIAKSF